MPGYDENRPWRHLYGRKWERERLRHLSLNPLCVHCLKLKRIEAATVVDHIKPHKGDVKLFRDRNNLQSLCKHCHDSWKQRVENGLVEVDLEGYPVDGSW